MIYLDLVIKSQKSLGIFILVIFTSKGMIYLTIYSDLILCHSKKCHDFPHKRSVYFMLHLLKYILVFHCIQKRYYLIYFVSAYC